MPRAVRTETVRPTLREPEPATNGSARPVLRRRHLPTGRAVIGGFLVALAAVGAFVAARGASDGPQHHVATAARDLPTGTVIADSDLVLAPADLPDGTLSRLFADDEATALVGRTTAAPLAQGDLVARAAVLETGARDPRPQLSIPLDRAGALDGLVAPGESVDVLATYGDAGGETLVVARGAEVVRVDDGRRSTLTTNTETIVVLAVGTADEALAVAHASHAGKVTLVRSGATAGADRYQPPNATKTG